MLLIQNLSNALKIATRKLIIKDMVEDRHEEQEEKEESQNQEEMEKGV